MKWWAAAAIIALGFVVIGLAYLGVRLGNKWDARAAANRRWKRFGFGVLSALTYLASGLIALFGVAGASVGGVSFIGGFAGWSTHVQGAIAGWLTILLVGIPGVIYIFSGFWNDVIPLFLPGAAKGTVEVEPAKHSDADGIRKRWSRADKWSPLAIALSAWVITSVLIPTAVQPSLPPWSFILFAAALLPALFIGVAPRFWQMSQYKNGAVRRVDVNSLPDELALKEVIIPRALVTPLFGAIIASVIMKGLPLPAPWNSFPLWAIVTPFLFSFITFPLTLTRSAPLG